MEWLGDVGNDELEYFKKTINSLQLDESVINVERLNDYWTRIYVNYSKFKYDDFFDYMINNLDYGKFKPTQHECPYCKEVNEITNGISYCNLCNKEYILE